MEQRRERDRRQKDRRVMDISVQICTRRGSRRNRERRD